MANPSWCFDVMTMYFIPESSANLTQASASNAVGLNWEASCAYSWTGIRALCMIHSPSPGTICPFHSPAGMAYRPQWINKPNLACRNHCIFASWEADGAACPKAGTAYAVNARTAQYLVNERMTIHCCTRPGTATGQSAPLTSYNPITTDN